MKKLMTILMVALFLAMGTQQAQAGVSIPPNTHWKCYRVVGNPPSPTQSVQLEDQFDFTTETVRRPKLICNPVDKNGEYTAQTDVHLTCYETQTPVKMNPAPTGVQVQNQFSPETWQNLRVVDSVPAGIMGTLPLQELIPFTPPNPLGGTHLLCVPSSKRCTNPLNGEQIPCPNEVLTE